MSKIKLNDKIRIRKEKFGGLIFDPEKEKIYTINSMAYCILRLIKEESESSVENIAQSICSVYPDVPYDIVLIDVKRILDEFIRLGVCEFVK